MRWNSIGGTVWGEQWNSDGGTVLWYMYSRRVLVEKWNSDGGIVLVEDCGGTMGSNSVGRTAIVKQ